MRGHVDAEALAMCREGLLHRRATARIRAHLSGCARCAELDAGLAEVPTLLAFTSVPAMPPELATRIEAALAAEAAGRPAEAAQPTVPAASPAAERPHTGPQRTRWGRPGVAQRVLAYAAAIVVVAGGGGYLLSHLASGSSGPASTSAGAPAHGAVPGAQSEGQASSATGSSGLLLISSGTDYRPGRLPAQATAALARYAPDTRLSAPAKQTPSAPVPSRQILQPRNLAALTACVARIAGGHQPQLVDVARYNGRPATIIVLRRTAQAPAEVWVVGPACSATRSDVITHTGLPGSG